MALRKYAFLTGALTIAVLQGCGGDDSAPAATGGAAGTGGSANTGGNPPGTGGAAPGTGGAATGGSSGSAGTGGAGTGGTVDSGPAVCTTAPYNNVFRFLGSTSDAWSINTASMPFGLVPQTTIDGAAAGTLVDIDSNDGMPAPGSVKLTIPFDGPNGQLIFQQGYGNLQMPGVNLKGATVSAQVRLDSLAGGAAASLVQGAIAIKATSAYNYAQGPSINLQTGNWVTVSMSADSALGQNPGFDLCDIREIDVLILTAASGTYGTAVVHIDTIAVTSGDAGVPPEPDGGSSPSSDASRSPDASDAGSARDGGPDVSVGAEAAADAPAASEAAPDAAAE